MKQQQQKYLYKLHKEKEKGIKAHKYQKKMQNKNTNSPTKEDGKSGREEQKKYKTNRKILTKWPY